MNMPYHLLLGRRDWQPLIDKGGQDVAWDSERQQLTLTPELMRFPPRASERSYTPTDRRGAAADRYGHLYWIDDDARAIRYRPAGSSGAGTLWTVADFRTQCLEARHGLFKPLAEAPLPSPRLRGLTVTTRSYLVVGTLEPNGLLVFDLHGGGEPRWHRWPDSVDFAPFDMAADPDGGLWILDLPTASEARLWYLDCTLRIGSPPGAPRTALEAAHVAVFHDLGGSPRNQPPRSYPGALSLALTIPLIDVAPVAIEALPDGTLLLLDQGPSATLARIHRLACGVALGDPIDLHEKLRKVFPDEPTITGHDLAFLPDEASASPTVISGTLYVAAVEGNQSFAFELNATASHTSADATTRYLPMRRYAGKALVSGPRDVYYDQAELWLALTELPRPRYARSGRLAGIVFDGKQPRCVWHRLFIDGCIPPGDAIAIESRAADALDELARVPWRQEQPLYLRRANLRQLPSDKPGHAQRVDEGERPFHRPFNSDALSHKGVGTWELLFQQTQGRYIELRLTITGSGRSSVKIRSLRVYYPRLSYPERFLPAVYREEPVSASFLERFLANFEGFYSEIEGRIATVQTLFDSRTAPGEALEWLAGWLGAVLDEDWDESRRRLFIRHAVDLYRQRGTLQGLIKAIRLAIDRCPDETLFDAVLDYAPFGVRIVENFARRALTGGLSLSAPSTLLPMQMSALSRWEPQQGGARLHTLWREFLCERYAPSGGGSDLLNALKNTWSVPPGNLGAVRFSPLTPTDPGHARDRALFIERWIKMPYAELDAQDVNLYRAYLRRKYGSIDAVNKAYGRVGAAAYASFQSVGLPENQLPGDGVPLQDWFQFATVDVMAVRGAHRFTVMVPVVPAQGPSERRQLLARVEAIVGRERPSHTRFDVQLYWALFRVGAARTGLDTVLGEGSRFTSLELGAGYIGEGLLAEHHPWNVTDRWVNGRDGVGPSTIG